jgi:cytochrome c-type biogenesis protein CcmF
LSALGWETGLLWAALAALLAYLAMRMLSPGATEWTQRADRLLGLSTLLLLFSLALLAAYFLAGHLSIQYVWTYTRTDYPWYYRLSGLWGGQAGTLVMWTSFTAAVAWIFDRHLRSASARADDPEAVLALQRRFRTVMAAITAGFLVVTLISRPFERTEAYFLLTRPMGNGLQPVLLTPFMIIHPPLQFVAYALTAILFAGGFINVTTGDRRWADAIRPWTRMAFTASTIGLGLGGLWAYYVLNFGGFWAWDPVETTNLLAWFPVTLLLHSLIYYDKGRFTTMAPLFALLTMPAALYATVATRTGLWVSVHAFTDPSRNFARDPFQRLLYILETSTLLQGLTTLLLLSLAAGVLAVALGRVRNWPNPRRRAARQVALGTSASLATLLILDPVGALSLAFEAAWRLSLGRSTVLGLLLLVGAVGLWIALGGKQAAETAAPRRRDADAIERHVTSRNVFALGILLLTLAYLVTFLLNALAVNGYSRQPYDDRAPYVSAPILLAMGLFFLLPALGPRRGLAAAIAALVIGVAASLLWSAHWAVALVAPALVFAAIGAGWRVLKTSRQPGAASAAARRTGALLMLAGLLGIVWWSNPPSRLVWPLDSVAVPWGLAIPGYAAAFGALLIGIIIRAREDQRLARLGGLLLIPAYGYGLSVLAAVPVLWASRRLLVPGERLRAWVGPRQQLLRRSVVYTLHVALVLGLMGVALATYEAHEPQEPVRFGSDEPGGLTRGFTFQVLSTRHLSPDPMDGGAPEEIHVDVLVLRDGRPITQTTLEYWHVHDGDPWHYDARTTVVRLPERDLYLYPLAFVFPDHVLVDHSTGELPSTLGATGVEMTIKVIPGMSLVWTGLWTITALMVANLVLGGARIEWSPAVRKTSASGAGADGT